jgi:hypothetical protein
MRLWRVGCLLVALLAFAGLVFVGCDADPATNPVYITPDSVTLSYGQAVALTATGGYEYFWSMAKPWGTFSNYRGSNTVYTSYYSPTYTNIGEVAVQTITVTSTLSGSGTSTSDAPYQVTAEAYITHL